MGWIVDDTGLPKKETTPWVDPAIFFSVRYCL
jgi:hypothetical protein